MRSTESHHDLLSTWRVWRTHPRLTSWPSRLLPMSLTNPPIDNSRTVIHGSHHPAQSRRPQSPIPRGSRWRSDGDLVANPRDVDHQCQRCHHHHHHYPTAECFVEHTSTSQPKPPKTDDHPRRTENVTPGTIGSGTTAPTAPDQRATHSAVPHTPKPFVC